MSTRETNTTSIFAGYGRSPLELATENLRQALRVLDLVPITTTDLTPHPIAVVRAEIMNARRHLGLMQSGSRSGEAAHA